MSSSPETLEEVDVEKQLKKQEETGDSESIVLSEKEDTDEEDENEEEDSGPTFDDSEIEDVEEGKVLKDGEILEDVEIQETKGNTTSEPIKTVFAVQDPIDSDELENLEDSDSDDEDLEYLAKLEHDINKETLLSFHPETKQINYKELLTLAEITRNSKGIIIDPLHTTLPFLTRYEKARILGLRAKQINHGSAVFVDVPRNIIDGHTIAIMELTEKKIPFIIRRPMPNGASEYWHVKDLENLE